MRNFILGTDWWSDCDDAVALRLLTRAVKRGDINLLGIGINACMEYSVASLKGFLSADGVDGIPVGIDRDATDYGGRLTYQKHLAENYGIGITNADAEDAIRLYRRILSESREKVEIVEIGFLQVIAGVLESGGDDISPKSGIELFREKVDKVWVMAGKWDGDGEKEHNFCLNTRTSAAAKKFCALCPVPVTFLGFEVGCDVITGGKLDRNDHLYSVLEVHGSANGRSSWDPMLVMMALIGDEEKAGYVTVTGTASVDAETGANYFVKSADGKHKYVTKRYENKYYEDQINSIINVQI